MTTMRFELILVNESVRKSQLALDGTPGEKGTSSLQEHASHAVPSSAPAGALILPTTTKGITMHWWHMHGDEAYKAFHKLKDKLSLIHI